MTPSAGPRLLGPAEVRSLAAELDLRPTKQRGQNFVIDANTVRRIVRESGVGPDDVVLEVGPGLGSLTLALLEVAARVVAVEIDRLLATRCPATVAEHAPEHADRFEVVAGRRAARHRGPRPAADRAGREPALQRLRARCCCTCWRCCRRCERGLVMVQAEVADRLAAGPGSKVYGVPSVKAAWFADVRRAGAVGRNVFWPAPNVDSGLVAWDAARPAGHHRDPRSRCSRSSTPRSPSAARRCAARCAGWPARAEAAEAALARAGIDPLARGEALDVADFAASPRRCASMTSSQPTCSARSPCARRPRSTSTSGSAACARTASTRSTPSSRRSGCTTTYRPPTATDRDGRPASTASTCPTSRSTSRNIVVRAARLLAAHRGRRPAAASTSARRIPVAGGMAGGSRRRRRGPGRAGPALGPATPATTCSSSWPRELGSDVPFALLGGTAHGTGRGELLHAIPTRGTWWWVVVPSPEGLSTPAVYRRFDEMFPRRARRRPASPPTCSPRCGRRRPTGSPPRSTTTSRPPRSTCARSSAT